MFRGAFKSKRCIIPIDGFYEWLREGKEKKPFAVSQFVNNARNQGEKCAEPIEEG